MDKALLKALIILLPAGTLVVWSAASFGSRRAVPSLIQLVGAGCLVVVALTHVAEALQLFDFMHWGSPHSVGHYLDLASALLGVTLVPLGYLWQRLTTPRAPRRG